MNPEGTGWKDIRLPQESIGVYGCSCSNLGQAGFITWSGSALIRNGITRNEPYGSSWIEIQNPSSVGLRQLCIGINVFWALDNQGTVYYRTGNNNGDNYGLKWMLVPGDMNTLSVSCTNQVVFIFDGSYISVLFYLFFNSYGL
jgi:hypothetical protein